MIVFKDFFRILDNKLILFNLSRMGRWIKWLKLNLNWNIKVLWCYWDFFYCGFLIVLKECGMFEVYEKIFYLLKYWIFG